MYWGQHAFFPWWGTRRMVDHHAESHVQARNRSFTTSSLPSYGSMPPFSFLDSFGFECSGSCDIFFNFFNFSTFQPTLVSHIFDYLTFMGHRSSLVMSHSMYRSDYSQVFYVAAIAYTAVAKSWFPDSSATPHLLWVTTTTAAKVMANHI